MIKDNPAGQGKETTPIVLIREKLTLKQKIQNTLNKNKKN